MSTQVFNMVSLCLLLIHSWEASLDGVVSCECCGSGVIEIKCPYSCKDKSFLEATSESTLFLERIMKSIV